MIALLLAWSTSALAGPCADAGDGFIVGPATAPLANGALGTPRRTCTRSEVGAAIAGDLTADTARFYGYIVGAAVIDGSVQVVPEVELTLRIETLRLDLGIASVSATSFGHGDSSIGVGWARDLSDRVALGVRGQVVLPTAWELFQQTRPLGVDAWITSVQAPHPIVRVHQGLGSQVQVTLGGPPSPGGALLADVGVEVRPVPVFGVAVDVDTKLFAIDTFDHLAVAGALRFGDGRRFGFELAVRAPLVGAERSLAAVLLRASGRLGPVERRR